MHVGLGSLLLAADIALQCCLTVRSVVHMHVTLSRLLLAAHAVFAQRSDLILHTSSHRHVRRREKLHMRLHGRIQLVYACSKPCRVIVSKSCSVSNVTACQVALPNQQY